MKRITLIVLIALAAACSSGSAGASSPPEPPSADAPLTEIEQFLDEYLAWLSECDDPNACAAQVENDPRYQVWLDETETTASTECRPGLDIGC